MTDFEEATRVPLIVAHHGFTLHPHLVKLCGAR